MTHNVAVVIDNRFLGIEEALTSSSTRSDRQTHLIMSSVGLLLDCVENSHTEWASQPSIKPKSCFRESASVAEWQLIKISVMDEWRD